MMTEIKNPNTSLMADTLRFLEQPILNAKPLVRRLVAELADKDKALASARDSIETLIRANRELAEQLCAAGMGAMIGQANLNRRTVADAVNECKAAGCATKPSPEAESTDEDQGIDVKITVTGKGPLPASTKAMLDDFVAALNQLNGN